jgi:hypothetical protein
MNNLHYKAIKKGALVCNRYARLCRHLNEAWRADLREANLQVADLRGADLREADLRAADLWEADLREADLRAADLRGANLQVADLREADLRGANLRGADLRGANLLEADLCGAGTVAYMTPYHVLVWPGGARVGCQCKDRAGWVAMTPEEAEEIASGGADWWRQFGPVVLAMIAEMDNQ